ncbi:nucleotidyltransferase domain-containing protein [bacterium]|nr:nucleotidyltransferase domain-containing protein [bacterium]
MKKTRHKSSLKKEIDTLKNCLDSEEKLELAVLVGSRATGTYHDNSDWDIAIRWDRDLDLMSKLSRTEVLRKKITQLDIGNHSKIDLIDITAAKLAMRAEISSNGILLVGDNTLAWSHFLLKIWRELEEFYWDKIYAT